MTKYIIKRILIAIPVLLGITVIDYAIMCMAGSPLEMLQGPRVSEAAVQAKAIALGLDKPFYVQYFVWLGQLLHGNMGYSIKNYQPVADMIASHLGPTLLLMGVSLFVSILLAVPSGIYSAIHQYSKGDYTVVTLSYLGSSIPGFFLAMLLIYLFTVKLGWLPSGGMTTLGTSGGAADVAAHMVMPVIVLAVSMAGTNIRYIRSAVLEILQQDYLRTARAKGIGHFLVINKHALRNALVPIVTVIGMEIPVLFGGSIIVEQVFSWPGLEWLLLAAALTLPLSGVLTYGKPQALTFTDVCAMAAAGFAIPWAFSGLYGLRMLEGGYLLVLTPLVAAFCSDSLALFTGMACGKHKLAPLVSPHKTVEGALGGLVGGMAGMAIFCLVYRAITGVNLGLPLCVALGLLGALLGELGDLSFSAVKRQYGIKDYGRLLPGHGGVLDRFDSVLFAAPVLCALLRALAA